MVLVILLVLVLGALFSGLAFLFRDYGKGERTLKALLFRVGFTLALIAFLLIGLGMGWIKVHPL
jgi:hypothetical protein